MLRNRDIAYGVVLHRAFSGIAILYTSPIALPVDTPKWSPQRRLPRRLPGRRGPGLAQADDDRVLPHGARPNQARSRSRSRHIAIANSMKEVTLSGAS